MKRLCLGVGREIITPEVGGHLYGYSPNVISELVADDLTVTAFYFEQNEIKALMLSITVCEMQTALCDSIRCMIEENYGIPKDNCMLCATHTHSGPNVAGTEGWGDIDREYCDGVLVPKIMSAVEKACNNLQPVRMGYAFGDSLVGVNRRELFPDNIVRFGQNMWGCINKRMTVVSFVNDRNRPVATMVHYGAHGTAAGMNKEITRDWSGIMTDALEKKTGAPSAFFNGTMGDIGPRISNGKTTGDLGYVYELGEIAARDALAIHANIKEYRDVSFDVCHNTLEIPLKERCTTEKAEKMYESYKDETENIGAAIRAYLENVIKLNKNGRENEACFKISQSTAVLGDLVFAGIPFEMFSETGMRIDKEIAGKSVLCVSNTNGFEGYFVTEDAICRGGYEVEMFLYGRPQQFCDNADWYLMKAMSASIKELLRKEEDEECIE